MPYLVILYLVAIVDCTHIGSAIYSLLGLVGNSYTGEHQTNSRCFGKGSAIYSLLGLVGNSYTGEHQTNSRCFGKGSAIYSLLGLVGNSYRGEHQTNSRCFGKGSAIYSLLGLGNIAQEQELHKPKRNVAELFSSLEGGTNKAFLWANTDFITWNEQSHNIFTL